MESHMESHMENENEDPIQSRKTYGVVYILLSGERKNAETQELSVDTINNREYIKTMIAINTEIPKELKRDIKVLAASIGKTFKQIVIEALTEKLEKENVKNN